MEYIIIDIEMNENKVNRRTLRETIEISAVKADKHFNIIGEYTSFVKPLLNPIITEYIGELTGIRQEEIDPARNFSEVFEEFWDWCLSTSEHPILCSWGGEDKKTLTSEVFKSAIDKKKKNRIVHYFFKFRYIDLQKDMKHLSGKQLGLDSALEYFGLKFEGTRHRGYYDALNTLKVLECIKNNKEKKTKLQEDYMYEGLRIDAELKKERDNNKRASYFKELAENFRHQEEYKTASDYILSGIELSEKLKTVEMKEFYREAALIHKLLKMPMKHYAFNEKRLLEELKERKDGKEQIEIMIELGENYVKRNMLYFASNYFRQIEKTAKKLVPKEEKYIRKIRENLKAIERIRKIIDKNK